MRTFITTSLKNGMQAEKIIAQLSKRGIECECAVTTPGGKTGQVLFER